MCSCRLLSTGCHLVNQGSGEELQFFALQIQTSDNHDLVNIEHLHPFQMLLLLSFI